MMAYLKDYAKTHFGELINSSLQDHMKSTYIKKYFEKFTKLPFVYLNNKSELIRTLKILKHY